MPEEPAATDALDTANERLRETAKWLVVSGAAVAAALIAGSQFAGLGQLPLGWPTSAVTARLWIAVGGAVIGLTAVIYSMWAAVQVLVPASVLIGHIVDAWNDRSGPLAPVCAFFRQSPKYLQGFATPAELVDSRNAAVEELTNSDGSRTAELSERVSDLDRRIEAVERMADHALITARFRRCSRRLIASAAVAALGIITFTWAANPPALKNPADLRNARLANAVLRDADLRNAKLDNADLSGADLTGADLTGASITGVRWANTICPDGVNSDAAGGTCAGHRRP